MLTWSFVCVRMHTGGLGTPIASQHNLIWLGKTKKFCVCSWRDSNPRSVDLESDALPIEPSRHPRQMSEVQSLLHRQMSEVQSLLPQANGWGAITTTQANEWGASSNIYWQMNEVQSLLHRQIISYNEITGTGPQYLSDLLHLYIYTPKTTPSNQRFAKYHFACLKHF